MRKNTVTFHQYMYQFQVTLLHLCLPFYSHVKCMPAKNWKCFNYLYFAVTTYMFKIHYVRDTYRLNGYKNTLCNTTIQSVQGILWTKLYVPHQILERKIILILIFMAITPVNRKFYLSVCITVCTYFIEKKNAYATAYGTDGYLKVESTGFYKLQLEWRHLQRNQQKIKLNAW